MNNEKNINIKKTNLFSPILHLLDHELYLDSCDQFDFGSFLKSIVVFFCNFLNQLIFLSKVNSVIHDLELSTVEKIENLFQPR
jgi:hypothetical protein